MGPCTANARRPTVDSRCHVVCVCVCACVCFSVHVVSDCIVRVEWCSEEMSRPVRARAVLGRLE